MQLSPEDGLLRPLGSSCLPSGLPPPRSPALRLPPPPRFSATDVTKNIYIHWSIELWKRLKPNRFSFS